MAILVKPSVDPAARWVALLAEHAPDEEVRVWPDIGPPGDIEFAIVRRPPPGALERCPRLRWVASIPAGVDPLLEPGVVPDRVPIIRCVSPDRGREMAEYVLLQVLRLHRRMPEYEAMMRAGTWEKLAQPPAARCRVGVMGLGELGEPVAERLRDAGFDTAGWTRTPRALAGVQAYHGAGQLRDFLARTDIGVCVLPLTPQTRGIINARTLSWMPRGAAVINVSRGAHVVEADLLEALERNHLGAACLDVLRAEPPPPDLPLLRHPAVYVTPHIACRSRAEDLLPGLLDNIGRARTGAPLLNLVGRDRGY